MIIMGKAILSQESIKKIKKHELTIVKVLFYSVMELDLKLRSYHKNNKESLLYFYSQSLNMTINEYINSKLYI